jgi:two-component system OmpR family sensor kinase/two-component system sensor histidine kinase BaeS
MLTAFALVIVLGVGGMSIFFWLAVANFDHDRTGMQMISGGVLTRDEVDQLAGYYAGRGESWSGVQERLTQIGRDLRLAPAQRLVLIDPQGQVVASSRPEIALPPAPPQVSYGQADDGSLIQTLPIEHNGRVVGSLMISLGGRGGASGPFFDRGRVLQGFASAALALAAILLGLAAIFSRRISQPLRQLTFAARSLAGGDMGVRVGASSVREIGELAGAFNRMAESLVRADQQRRQLTADVAHELRTPLSIIKGRLEGIQDGVYRPDSGQIDGLLGEVALLERLIEDLRLLALAEAGQLPLYPELVEPADLLRAAARSFAPQAAERGVALELAVPADLPDLQLDPQRIAQVLGNLVGNALRHTPAGGSVCLSAVAADDAVTFAVRDSGVGIEPADLPHIFDRFYRADRSRTRSSGGAGLGLAIARRMVEAHGGVIWAESTPGLGTTVSFRLPTVEPPR